jgi:hypothetical protein
MAVLNKEEFFDSVRGMVGSDTSDASIKFVEDMTDTYSSLEAGVNGDGVDWEKKCREVEEFWKSQYRSRFFSSPMENNPNGAPGAGDAGQAAHPEDIDVQDLFK